MLPESWVETTVGKILVDLQPGFAQKPGEDDEGMTPQIRTHNISPDGKITLDGIKHVSVSTKSLERYLLAKGDIVFNNTNSEELVGKTAVFDQDGEFVFSNHMTRLRADNELVAPKYLAGYLQLLWSMGYSKTRAKRWVNQAGIESKTLSSFKIFLPTLPEQQRIVEVLRLAEAVVQDQQSRHKQLNSLLKAVLDPLVLAVDSTKWVQLGKLVDTRYGTSVSAEATAASGTPVLRIPNVVGGEVNAADLKYVTLPQTELKRLRLTDSDVLIVRSNGNPDYVGRSAPITSDIVLSQMVYASYLIRLRSDKSRLLPEYLSAFLNSPFGRAAMRNAIRTTAGQSNLSAENLVKVKIPLPTIGEQKIFRDFWFGLQEVRKLINASDRTANELQNVLTAYALSGNLTDSWREQHREQISEAAKERDALLRAKGFNTSPFTEVVPPTKLDSASLWRTRQWLRGELSEFQRQIFDAFIAYPEQPLLAEDAHVFSIFCDDENVSACLTAYDYSPNSVRRVLGQLAALGLIATLTLPRLNQDTGEREYLKAFRPLRADEFTRLSDVDALQRLLSSGGPQYHFSVMLDYETSERAGAAGMFQVISITDDDGSDHTSLVDQGTHYPSLDGLRQDLARRLSAHQDQVDLEEV